MLKADLHVVYFGYVSMMITCKMLVYAVILGVKSQLLLLLLSQWHAVMIRLAAPIPTLFLFGFQKVGRTRIFPYLLKTKE